MNKALLKKAYNTLHKREGYPPNTKGSFSDLMMTIATNLHIKELIHDGPTRRLEYLFHNLIRHKQTLCMIIQKINWFKSAKEEKTISEIQWMYYLETDIAQFYATFYSLFNEISKLLTFLSKCKISVPADGESFEKLINWLKKRESNRGHYGEELSKLVLSAEWFLELREVRVKLLLNSK